MELKRNQNPDPLKPERVGHPEKLKQFLGVDVLKWYHPIVRTMQKGGPPAPDCIEAVFGYGSGGCIPRMIRGILPSNLAPPAPKPNPLTGCELKAQTKAEQSINDIGLHSTALPAKEAGAGAISGAATGCIWGLFDTLGHPGGCVVGAVESAWIGAVGGAIKGTVEGFYNLYTGYQQVKNQLHQDVAACRQ